MKDSINSDRWLAALYSLHCTSIMELNWALAVYYCKKQSCAFETSNSASLATHRSFSVSIVERIFARILCWPSSPDWMTSWCRLKILQSISEARNSLKTDKTYSNCFWIFSISSVFCSILLFISLMKLKSAKFSLSTSLNWSSITSRSSSPVISRILAQDTSHVEISCSISRRLVPTLFELAFLKIFLELWS